MASVSDSTSSAAFSAANVRSELATNAIRDNNEQERQTAERLEEADATEQQQERENRQIPGLGNAVDITV
ncbi:hypothetical protein JM93_03277 [Roseibium hamelinense]|uniref:Uncharacterized protein n=1 Tax=Roseibium hamelinense TaxID=150831 RepID=A0A562SNU3_9HYPH|nr:hypothetical protein [Roseibium hamelinense]MTI44030.1 hypothetical protein [Roseibium hamelinense]TWI82763.1 hypothetical protein JM93_03277 [Roseibium hamelinense]